jgi:hypothetical protein
MQNTGKRCVILLFFIILRWSFNYESNVFRYNKILIDCVFGNSKFLVPSTLTINLDFASVNSQCLRDNKRAIPSYSVNKYIVFTCWKWYSPGDVISLIVYVIKQLQTFTSVNMRGFFYLQNQYWPQPSASVNIILQVN